MGAGAAGISTALASCGAVEEPTNPFAQPTIGARAAEPTEGNAAIASVADVPVGGGMVLAEAGVVLTQPAEGDIKGFTASCTHYGCTVASIQGGTINCDCHGSKFDMADGAVRNGPATTALPAVAIRVEGGEIFLSEPSGT